MRAIESRSESAGVSTDALMENAGLAVARCARRQLGALTGVRVVVLVGPGNNGGDGLVTARHLRRWGARVAAYLYRDRPPCDSKLDAAAEAGVAISDAASDPQLERLEDLLASAHLVIDAILGTGRARPVTGVLARILAKLGDARKRSPHLRLLAMDMPTGLDCDSAELDALCVAADVTVALGFPKRGHLAFPGAGCTGKLEVADIGIPPGLEYDVRLELMTREWARSNLPDRRADSHKGSYGRAMIAAGSKNFLGAAHLAAAAATRVGAGLVTVAIPESLIGAVAPGLVEPTYVPLPESSPGVVSAAAARILLESLDGYSALLMGCGLGMAAQTQEMVREVLLTGRELPPAVIDADGLNALARTPDWRERWTREAALTPHPGEMARLSRDSAERIGRERLDVALEGAARWNKTVVLKGAHTIVAHPDGSAMIAPFANPGLATAGSGDVLAGAIAGLLSQGLSVADAASLGVYLHGLAGDAARERLGDAGMIASDLLPELPKSILRLREGGRSVTQAVVYGQDAHGC